ncbi:unnamed protein product [Pleuronectes platessa]|uniref:Uncharacterized protein n=1 Tax=Pleuronectes platessa TaxID=8262 RepID=A0A9N7UTT6_PLEPL|nr:unnamed protein product [Pleuronectes platessa]
MWRKVCDGPTCDCNTMRSAALPAALESVESIDLEEAPLVFKRVLQTLMQNIKNRHSSRQPAVTPCTLHKHGRHDAHAKLKPKPPVRPLLAGCSSVGCHPSRCNYAQGANSVSLTSLGASQRSQKAGPEHGTEQDTETDSGFESHLQCRTRTLTLSLESEA